MRTGLVPMFNVGLRKGVNLFDATVASVALGSWQVRYPDGFENDHDFTSDSSAVFDFKVITPPPSRLKRTWRALGGMHIELAATRLSKQLYDNLGSVITSFLAMGVMSVPVVALISAMIHGRA